MMLPLLFSVLSACGSAIRFVPNGTPVTVTKTPVEKVQVFFNPPQTKYTSIGIFTWNYYQPGWHEPDITEAVPKIKQKASDVGADATIINRHEVDSSNGRLLHIGGEFILVGDK